MSGENNNRTITKTNVVPPSCNAKRGFLQCKSMVFASPKNHTFAAQKGGFLQSIVIQIVTQYCFSHILFPL